jgi:putative oxidoreductase
MNGGTKLFIPSLGGIYDALGPWMYAFVRFCFGAMLMVHGYFKLFAGGAAGLSDHLLGPMGFPDPLAWAYFLGILEFFGCAALAVGLLTRPIALMLAVEMAIITFGVHFTRGFAFSSPGGGYEYPLLLLILSIAFLFRGGGRYSLDHAIGKEF